MGKSKFPGKPSKLVNKKRVSVLNGVLSHVFSDNLNEDDVDYLSNNQISLSSSKSETAATTIGGHDGDVQNNSSEKPNPPDPPDILKNTDIDGNPGSFSARGRRKTMMSTDIPETQVKKKTVTFKSILETSDDMNIVKKVYNPDKVPAVPIIKISKNIEDLSRSERFARGDIVMPSRLTEVLKNYSANHIDKLNLLTFKSSHVTFDQQNDASQTQSVSFGQKADRDTAIVCEKKFVLPKRSVHSCRVIKPNKRFLDDSHELSRKYSNKLYAGKKCYRRSELFLKSFGKPERTQKTDNFINNTLSSQINSSRLNEVGNAELETASPVSVVQGDTDNPDNSDNKTIEKARPTTFSMLQGSLSSSTLSSPKIILRQSRLQFPSTSFCNNSTTDGPFSLNLGNTTSTVNSAPASASGISSGCMVCGSVASQQTGKFGINSCENCKKFISRIIKTPCSLECQKPDGTCVISIASSNTFPNAIKERCQACWFNKCLKAFPEIRNKMQSIPAISTNILSPFRIKMETIDNNSTNIFSNNTGTGRLITNSIGDSDFKSKLSNPLVENNSTFGSSPLMKPSITEKPVIMVGSTSISDVKSNNKESKTVAANCTPAKEVEDVSRLRVRKKEPREQPATVVTFEPSKRQRIDLKGPRVKHVCRSASIVLGQPIATFPHDETSVLDNMDTPPRPDSALADIPEMERKSTLIAQDDEQESHQSSCTDCTTNSPLSPPTTPIHNQESEDEIAEPIQAVVEDVVVEESISLSEKPIDESNDIDIAVVPDTESLVTAKLPESLKPVTRKLAAARPAHAANKFQGITSKKLNAFSKQMQKSPIKSSIPQISIDFWENYDPAEVSQTGFGLIVSEKVPLRAICFLCGSAGQDPLMFCVCCCEPYHQYCVEDEYNVKHTSMDDTNASMIDAAGNTTISSLHNRLNWLCPRCTVCYTCNMASGSKVKCQKCQKNYHSTCLGTSKRLLGADRPLICANCLKCKSCGTTNVSKFVGNLPMCSSCFKLRQKGNFCPLCQKCYEDNDFNIKMMECGDCRRWVHAKCEGLTDEQYNMLSVLPENIEFICKKCAKNNSAADTWREAVAAEFKLGLLSVVRLLSKSRQACALLKLSPRKKPGACVCQPVQSNRNISFTIDKNNDEGDDEFEEEDPLKLDTEPPDINICMGNKCYCGAGQLLNQHQRTMSLLDIKQKVNTNKYYSLADFNYDMNLIINAASCDELLITYKEILSETFPWFQNETKACTDALEEDMYDSCNFTQNSTAIEFDQQVPMIGIPDDIDDYFYTTYDVEDVRVCLFCKGMGEGISLYESRLLYCGQNGWIHTNCAMWSAEVFEEIDGSLQNVHSAISRGRLIKCSKCGIKGATVGCNVRTCGEHYHYPCARNSGCAFMIDKTVYCPQHLSDAKSKTCSFETDFEVIRPVYVELDRKKKKLINPSKVQFMIGSLKVQQLGKFVPTLSDTRDAIVPADFLCTRLYWSSKEPWKIVEYTVRTYIHNNNVSVCMDTGRNIIVDHSCSDAMLVGKKLAQISKWHSSLARGEYYEYETTNCTSSSDETSEDEPQHNADLLPPELKDAIFEDLPHDILDGISMLDIFPKLMTYEDLVAMDSRNEVYLSSDMSRDGRDYNMSDDDFSDNQKDYDGGDSWIGNNVALSHVEDALLSTARPMTSSTHRELKRSKSEIFQRGSTASRSHQRSSSLTWSCKLDTNSVSKRRKMSRFDLRIPDGLFLSLGRRKDDLLTTTNVSERRLSLQTDEIKNKNFTWSAAKKLAQIEEGMNDSYVPRDILDKLKISQLDGMDDVSSGSESGSPAHEFTINTNFNTNFRESPVKCDRCHCTYRTYDSYHRHLPTCEPLSTSESESETTPRSPDIQSQTQNMIITSIGGQEYCSMPTMMTSQQQQQPHQIYNINGQQINSILQNFQQPIQIHNSQLQNVGNNLQGTAIPIQNQCGIQNNGIPIHNMILNPSNVQQQVFSQPMGLQQQMFPLQNISQPTNMNQFTTDASGSVDLHGKTLQHITSTPQTISFPNGINIQASQQPLMHQQPQIITFTQANNNSQIMTITQAQQQNFASPARTTAQSSPYKNQLILPQPERTPPKRQTVHKIIAQANSKKGRPPAKAIHIKRAGIKTETKPMQLYNQAVPVMRQVNQNDGNIILQQSPSQPIIMQQLNNNPGNLVQYVTDSGMQYIALPTQSNDFKHPQQQYLAPNQLMSGTYQIQTDGGNLLLSNSPASIQVLPNGTLQLTQPQQPQVIGTLIQNQPASIQCGMMSTDHLGYSTTPTLEMVANPSNGCMLLTSQPVYYGLETIVQNTVMSSQQFVSSAMQGVLSQNSSFSATTTQVFQASKIEPIMEMPAGYVVLNNDGTIMQPQPHTQNIISNNVIPQNLNQIQSQPQLQAAPQPQQQQQNEIQPNATWRYVEEKPSIQIITQAPQNPSIAVQPPQLPHQILQTQPKEITIKSPPPVVSKMQSQTKSFGNNFNHNIVAISTSEHKPNPIILPKPVTSLATVDGQHYMIQSNLNKQQATVSNSQQFKGIAATSSHVTIQPIQRKTNLIRPIATGTKITATNVKPKFVSKPVVTSNLYTNKSQIDNKIYTITSTAVSSESTTPVISATNTAQTVILPIYQPSSTESLATHDIPELSETDNKGTITYNIRTEEPNTSANSIMKTVNVSILNSNENSIAEQSVQSTSISTVNTPKQPSSTELLPPSTSSSHLTSYTQHQSHNTFNTNSGIATCQSTSQLITLPTTASIQLPIAPYAPPYSNGIPTNVVNPIQQYNNYSSANVSRPTNRVLPMQTLQQKDASPPTPPETKLLEVVTTVKKDITIDTTIDTTKFTSNIEQEPSPNHLEIIEKSDDDGVNNNDNDIDTDNDDSNNDDANVTLSNIVTQVDNLTENNGNDAKSRDQTNNSEYTSSTDHIFDKLKCETENLLIRGSINSEQNKVTKNNFCEILNDLAKDNCSKPLFDEPTTSIFEVVDTTNHIQQQAESSVQLEEEDKNTVEQKENLNPIPNSPDSNKKSLKLNNRLQHNIQKPSGPKMLYEIQSQDGFTYKSTSVTDIWEKVFEAVQLARKAHGLAPLPEGPLADMCGHQMMGLKTNALKYLVEQLPGVEKCSKYTPRYHTKHQSATSTVSSSGYSSDLEELKENSYGASRCEGFKKRSEYDMFSWLASRHRKQPIQVVVNQNTDIELIPRRGTGSNLPMAMRYRTLKETYKETVGVYRSHIHGRGLFCNRDIEAGEMVIEYAGELIRSTLTDKRERYYDGRGIGCYMFKIDENLVVDATMRGNAARFINHACEPNCYSKVVDILGHKHIIIFALRRIVQGEELTYDYKFPFEETKIPCSCGSRKCRKYLN